MQVCVRISSVDVWAGGEGVDRHRHVSVKLWREKVSVVSSKRVSSKQQGAGGHSQILVKRLHAFLTVFVFLAFGFYIFLKLFSRLLVPVHLC